MTSERPPARRPGAFARLRHTPAADPGADDAVPHLHLEHRLRRGGRPVPDRAALEHEGAAVPGADEAVDAGVVHDLPSCSGPGQVRAGVGEHVDRRPAPDDDDRGAAHRPQRGLALAELGEPAELGPVAVGRVRDRLRVVRARGPAVGEVRRRCRRRPRRRRRRADRASGRSPAGRGRAAPGTRRAGRWRRYWPRRAPGRRAAARAAAWTSPWHRPRRRGGGGEADGEQRVGRPVGAGATLTVRQAERHGVDERGARPGADRQLREHGVHGVAEPHAVKGVPDGDGDAVDELVRRAGQGSRRAPLRSGRRSASRPWPLPCPPRSRRAKSRRSGVPALEHRRCRGPSRAPTGPRAPAAAARRASRAPRSS